MSSPRLSIIIPTHDRPTLLPSAVRSALRQREVDLEVIVVDDASDPPVRLPGDPRLRVIRLDRGRGGAGARNAGTQAARGRWVTYLDDDDRLLPHMAEVSLAALATTRVCPPVAVLSGLQEVGVEGEILCTRLPPTHCPKGSHFFLEEREPGRSYHTKQTLVVERDLLLSLGGWDERFCSRVHSDLFLRLNPVCSLIGVPTVTYQLLAHEGPRVSDDPQLRQQSFARLIQQHRAAFDAHPEAFAEFVYKHAVTSLEAGQRGAAMASFLWALRLDPRQTAATTAATATRPLRRGLRRAAEKLRAGGHRGSPK